MGKNNFLLLSSLFTHGLGAGLQKKGDKLLGEGENGKWEITCWGLESRIGARDGRIDQVVGWISYI